LGRNHSTRPNTLFSIAGVLALVFGPAFLLLPTSVLPLYGIEPEPATVLVSRFFGGALVQLGTALYLVREVRVVIYGLLLVGYAAHLRARPATA
jgi:hypothetical protein